MPSAGARAASNMVKDLATLLATTVQRSIVERLDHISHSDQQEGCYLISIYKILITTERRLNGRQVSATDLF